MLGTPVPRPLCSASGSFAAGAPARGPEVRSTSVRGRAANTGGYRRYLLQFYQNCCLQQQFWFPAAGCRILRQSAGGSTGPEGTGCEYGSPRAGALGLHVRTKPQKLKISAVPHAPEVHVRVRTLSAWIRCQMHRDPQPLLTAGTVLTVTKPAVAAGGSCWFVSRRSVLSLRRDCRTNSCSCSSCFSCCIGTKGTKLSLKRELQQLQLHFNQCCFLRSSCY